MLLQWSTYMNPNDTEIILRDQVYGMDLPIHMVSRKCQLDP